MTNIRLFIFAGAAALAAAFTVAAPAHAAPGPVWPDCVTPDGTPCPPPPTSDFFDAGDRRVC
jgi:hypothetical protein